jgi:hypothetical protein
MKYKGGEEMPPNGGIVHPENVQMKPFFSKGELNVELSVQVPGRTVISNGLPGGHTDLNRCHPGVEKDFAEGVLIIIMFSTSFRPEIIYKEATEDVEWLPGVNEAAGVVREEAWGVVFVFQGGFTKESKRPGDLDVSVGFPFDPEAFVGFPGELSLWAIEQAVLRGLFDAQAANLALRGEAHDAEPGAHWEALVEREPYESARLSWASAMPNSGDGFLRGSVSKVEPLDESDHVRGVRRVPGVDVPSFGGVVEETRVPKRWGGAPAPFPWVLGEVLYESSFEDPEGWGLLVGGFQLLGNLEVCSESLLSQNSDWEKVAGGDSDYLVCGGLYASPGGALFEFDDFGLARSCSEYEVDPVWGAPEGGVGLLTQSPSFGVLELSTVAKG